MNALAPRVFLVRSACFAFGVLCISGADGFAQSGGINQTGPGKGGDAFKLWTLRCTIKGNVPTKPSPEEAGARWRTKGSQKWNTSDEKVLLPPATYTIEFKGKLDDWISPADRTIVLDRDKPESATYRRKGPEPTRAEKVEPKPTNDKPKQPKGDPKSAE
jgi:hypothetical protein